MGLFQESNDLKIGSIVEVNGTSIKVKLDESLGNLSRTIDGKVYSIGQMASIIKIHFGRKVIFAFVRMLRMNSEVEIVNDQKIAATDDSRILEADLFGEGNWVESIKTLKFSRGVETYPLPLQNVYLTIREELEAIYHAAEQGSETNRPMLKIGNYVGASSAICRANIDKLFGNHSAILGSTGSGKSATVAAILHSVLEYEEEVVDNKLYPRVILIDPHGEYSKAFKDKAIVYRAYSEASTGGEHAEVLKLPYWLMSGDEFRSLIIGKTEYEATSQNNIVYEALSYARMVHAGIIKPFNDPEGNQPLELCVGKTEEEMSSFDRDKPVPFSLEQFIKHINEVQGRKVGKKESRPPSDSDRQKIESILKKVRVLRANPQLKFLMEEFNESSPTLTDVLAQFVGTLNERYAKSNLRIIDISGLPNEVSGLLAALISRLLFQYKIWQTPEERKKDPILLVCEEAHRYVPNHGEAQYKDAQESIRRIAKEGRKYGLGLMLVSQRPSDVESTVLSQCNTWIVLRLTNSSDQEHVAKFLPDTLSGLTRILSSLTRREAIFVGEAAALPARIKIRELKKEMLPDSEDISFVKGWQNELMKDEQISTIANRWTGSSK
ncbi:MAG: ATP-binding protein [Anaerovoracaceae bacterium]|jgi:DNA helicase HerA-like ATPase